LLPLRHFPLRLLAAAFAVSAALLTGWAGSGAAAGATLAAPNLGLRVHAGQLPSRARIRHKLVGSSRQARGPRHSAVVRQAEPPLQQSVPLTAQSVFDRVGFITHLVSMPPADDYAYKQRATAAGVHWFREDFAWSALEPQKGRYNWAPTDRLMTNASKLGADIMAIVAYSPGWASGHVESDKYPPKDSADYARFAAAVASRYGRGGTFWSQNPALAPRPLQAIEIWNEPWLWGFWRPNPDPQAYAALVRAAAPAIKAAAPQMKVILSGDLHVGFADGRANSWLNGWLAQLLRQDLPMASLDGWAVHPYCGDRGPYQTTIQGFADQTYAQQWLYQQLLLVRDMTTAAGKFKPIWSTEVGWSTAGDVDEATQAAYVRDAVKRAVGEWSSFVARSFVYVLEKPHNGDRDGGYSLLRDDGSPKPAWTALQAFIRS
jgi:beta-mannanase